MVKIINKQHQLEADQGIATKVSKFDFSFLPILLQLQSGPYAQASTNSATQSGGASVQKARGLALMLSQYVGKFGASLRFAA